MRAILTPHGASCDGFPVHAHAILALARSLSQRPDPRKEVVFVILGTDHRMRPSCVSLLDWDTPLGRVRNNLPLTEKLVELGLPVNEQVCAEEHSLEPLICSASVQKKAA